jgi:hypothetical protein
MSEQTQEESSSNASPPPTPAPNRKRQYWLGIAYGAIPLVILLLSGVVARVDQGNYGVAGFPSTVIGLIGCVILLVVTIIYLAKREKRFIGYGLLTMLLITPVVGVYGCILIIQGHV